MDMYEVIMQDRITVTCDKFETIHATIISVIDAIKQCNFTHLEKCVIHNFVGGSTGKRACITRNFCGLG